MNERDKAILSDLRRFRVMRRNDIQELHFSHLSDPKTSSNRVLKRLRRDGYVEVNTSFRPYLYFPTGGIKKDSMKINHFLAIVDFYKRVRKVGKVRQFEVEPKPGHVEPDGFLIVNNAPFYIEIQRNEFSDKVMSAKMKRYEKLLHSGEWRGETWQPEKPVFPVVWMLTDKKYKLVSKVKVIQTRTVEELFK